MENAAHIGKLSLTAPTRSEAAPRSARRFVLASVGLALACLVLAGALPLQASIVTVFLFAGPHNWFELRYFISRLPARFGRSRNYFLVAFVGIGGLTLAYALLPVLGYRWWWSGDSWLVAAAVWNTAALAWVAALVVMRGRQSRGRDWRWAIPAAMFLAGLNWMAPDWFGLGLVYLHPLVALWFLDRHLGRTRPEWRGAYRRCLAALPVLLLVLWVMLAGAPSLVSADPVAQRITAHAGSGLLPNISSHLLVGTHVFLEMLHYGVWLLAIPLIARHRAFVVRPSGGMLGESQVEANRLGSRSNRVNAELPAKHAFVAPPSGGMFRNLDPRSLPLFNHPRGWPKMIVAVLVFGALAVIALWFGFGLDYATTRDIYFTLAMAHVLAEAPFLLRTI